MIVSVVHSKSTWPYFFGKTNASWLKSFGWEVAPPLMSICGKFCASRLCYFLTDRSGIKMCGVCLSDFCFHTRWRNASSTDIASSFARDSVIPKLNNPEDSAGLWRWTMQTMNWPLWRQSSLVMRCGFMVMTQKSNFNPPSESMRHHQGPKKHSRFAVVLRLCWHISLTFVVLCIMNTHHMAKQSVRNTTWGFCITCRMLCVESGWTCGQRRPGNFTTITCLLTPPTSSLLSWPRAPLVQHAPYSPDLALCDLKLIQE